SSFSNALSSTASFFNGERSTPGTIPATSQLDWPISSRRLVLHLVRELRGICSNRSAVAWGAPLIRWSDDGAIVLAARPIASLPLALAQRNYRLLPSCDGV